MHRRKLWLLAGAVLVALALAATGSARVSGPDGASAKSAGTLVFGAWEPRTGAVGSLWDVVRDRRLNHRPEVHSGVLEAECAALVRDFFQGHR